MAAAKKTSTGNALLVLVIALIAVEHDGVRYEKDEEFSLPADAVKPLADVNAVKIVAESTDDSAAQTNANT